MKTVLVFSGTTEGRELAESLSKSGISCHVCVATEYGNQVIRPSEYITVHSGRLDEAGMRTLYEKIGCEIVVDATHPFAQIVTDTIKKSVMGTEISYMRLLRKNDVDADAIAVNGTGMLEYADIVGCVAGLERTEGNILLTTGSKQLKEFTDNATLRSRIIARVLPGMESLKLCYEAGLEGRQIIAMQGPFSKEMNEAIIRDYNIRQLVTKESGVTGGVDSKLEAAMETGITVHMIKRPSEAEADGMGTAEVIDRLEIELGCRIIRGSVSVTLVGIGPGSNGLLTVEAVKAIETADFIFGAPRMIEAVEGRAVKYPYYLQKDILPVLEEKSRLGNGEVSAVILFSGDSGFYSGAAKMYESLKNETDYEIKVIPGISSVSILAARLGISWQEGVLLSTHGIADKVWIPKLADSVRHNEKTFFLTSGVKDINTIGALLKKLGGKYEVFLGRHISYEDEKIVKLTADECAVCTEEGLYTGLIVSKYPEKRILVPSMSDDDFVRGRVPMTKEAVRKLSICRMKIKEGDIIYDIGGGTGSVSVQAAALSPTVRVYSLECNEEAVALIRENAEKAGLNNISVINAMAPKGLDELPAADVCFIGGSRGNLKAILDKLESIKPSMRVVMNAVSMENICEMNHLLEVMSVTNVSVEQVAVTNVKELGSYHMLNANNPVFIFSFEFKPIDG